MTAWCRPAVIIVALLTVAVPSAAFAEEVSVYGITLPPISPTPGALQPAGTNLACYGLDEDGRCWDGGFGTFCTRLGRADTPERRDRLTAWW
jgi:hypothetical protein